jgi:hypothetical protein
MTEVPFTSLDGHGLGAFGCSIGPHCITNDIQVQPGLAMDTLPPPQGGALQNTVRPFSCCFDHGDLTTKVFHMQLGGETLTM